MVTHSVNAANEQGSTVTVSQAPSHRDMNRRRVGWVAAGLVAMSLRVVVGWWPWYVAWPRYLVATVVVAGPGRVRMWLTRKDQRGWSVIVLAFVSLIAQVVVIGGVALATGPLAFVYSTVGILQATVSSVLLGPLVAFRGTVQTGIAVGLRHIGMRRRGVHRVVAAVIAAFVWSMWHTMLDGEPTSMLRTLPAGIVWDLYVALGGSIRTTILAHTLTILAAFSAVIGAPIGLNPLQAFLTVVLLSAVGFLLTRWHKMTGGGLGRVGRDHKSVSE